MNTALQSILKKGGIEVHSISYRVKDFDSFWNKFQRKLYKEPFKQVEDLCGLRIICFYSSDLAKVASIIHKEFVVKESVNKETLLAPDSFGYRSLHFIVTVKDSWLNAPNYRELDGIKAEIQVRTILMHAWADFEHKLLYKRPEHVPNQFKRTLCQLSALFEVADEQFDNLRKEKERYRRSITPRLFKENPDLLETTNLDNLQAVIDIIFPTRVRDIHSTRWLLDEMLAIGISTRDFVVAWKKARRVVPEMEKEVFGRGKAVRRWSQAGAARAVLELGSDKFWKSYYRNLSPDMKPRATRWRAKLAKLLQSVMLR